MTKISYTLMSLLLLTSLSACTDDAKGDGDTGTEGPTGNEDPTGELDGSFCAHTCTATADCTINGVDVGLTCVDTFCVGDDAEKCTGDAECVALFSGWTTACTAGGGECEATAQVCVSEGLCATAPSDFIECSQLMQQDLETTDIDGNPVTVCANTNAECNSDGACTVPCKADSDCTSPAQPVCNVGSGLCECGKDADCETIGEPAFSVCNAGSCGCAADQQCLDSAVGDVCLTGYCGCSGDMACESVTNTFDGGSISCVEF